MNYKDSEDNETQSQGLISDSEASSSEKESDVPRNDMSSLNCFQVFMLDEVVESLCLWTNVHAAKFFMDNPTINPKKFMNKICQNTCLKKKD
ncbi:hypothetical protein E2C01_070358 [Portunus trituberculatus]|uniref:Uncharacterized protein n=1 Tax=Portunus trituberculatus TaxID=210409 RepID=A0A5B7I3A3_PORTR|nr:hypothetical protein [Portunus trituberculatus]